MSTEGITPAFHAFETQLNTLCLREFPCGIGSWKEDGLQTKTTLKKNSPLKKDNVSEQFSVTLKDYGAEHIKTEQLEEFLSSKRSPWNQDYSWSKEAKDLREIAVKSPWLIDEKFVLAHFKTLRIVDKGVSEIDPNFLKFPSLRELTLTTNKLRTIHSENLPRSLQLLEVCANQISNLADLCVNPPHLLHLGLGHNLLTMVDDYITGEYWPSLLSLDLSHNNLSDLMDIVKKLQTLPKLRNLLLQGNPLSLIPGYRGYVIDSLRNLDFLDDIALSADEKHHFKGLARRKEFILDEAKMHFYVETVKGILKPEELKNPEDVPEYPVITRNYYLQFNFLEDMSTNADIFRLDDDDQVALTDRLTATEDAQTVNTDRDSAITQTPFAATASYRSMGQGSQAQKSQQDISRLEEVNENAENIDGDNTQRTQSVVPESEIALTTTLNSQFVKSQSSVGAHEMEIGPVIRLAPVKTVSSTWMEEMPLNWHSKQNRDDLLSLRDFLLQGMDISVMEEKILSYPAEQVQDGVVTPVAKDKGKKKDDKKKEDAKKGKKQVTSTPKKTPPTPRKKQPPPPDDGKKKKKKGEPDIEMTHLPAEYTELASFHVPLKDFLEGEYKFENVFTKSWESSSGMISPVSDITTISKDKKDKKKSPSKKDSKEKTNAKDPRKSPKVERKASIKDKSDKNKSKVAVDDDDIPPPPPPPLEVHVKVKLHHWRTAMDSLKDEQEEAQAAAAANQ